MEDATIVQEQHHSRVAIVDPVNVHGGSSDFVPWFDYRKACIAEAAANPAKQHAADAATADKQRANSNG